MKRSISLDRIFVSLISATVMAVGLHGAAAQHCLTSTDGLIGWWTGDEDASDLTGNGDGVLVGGANAGAEGIVDGAFSFDGVTGHVVVGNEPHFDLERTDAFSVLLWLKTDSDEVGNILSKTSLNRPSRGFQLIKHRRLGGARGVQYANRLYLFLTHDAASGNMIRLAAYTGIADDRWHHVAVTYDGSSRADGVRMFLDGKEEILLVTDDNLSGSILNDVPLQISGREGGNSVFDGRLDEVKFYDRALSPEEIRASYCVELQLEKLRRTLSDLDLPKGPFQRMENRLSSALRALGKKANERDGSLAPRSVRAFMQEVITEAGGAIGVGEAESLVSEAFAVLRLLHAEG